MKTINSIDWLALVIGNSRLHWALFRHDKLQQTWDTAYLSAEAIDRLVHSGDRPGLDALPPPLQAFLTGDLPPLFIASVVPAQTTPWQAYPHAHFVTLDHIPLKGLYPTFGIDRALALWGAMQTWKRSILAIDAGTALTFTGANADRCLVGGAILPGVRLQFEALAIGTAALPSVQQAITLPPRWATNTPQAIQSGILYTLLAGIRDFMNTWLEAFPDSAIVLTGGDAEFLMTHLKAIDPTGADRVAIDSHLVFRGIPPLREGCFRGRD